MEKMTICLYCLASIVPTLFSYIYTCTTDLYLSMFIYIHIYNWYIDEVRKITHSCFVIILFSVWHSHAIEYFLPHRKSIFFLHCIIISIWSASDAILLILYETIHVDNEFNIFNVLWLYLSWIMFIHSFCNICAVLIATQLTDRTDQHIFIMISTAL